MKVKKVSQLQFHRNGIGGEPFYSAIIKISCRDEDEKNEYLITFTTTEKEKEIVEIPSCRVVELHNPLLQWRGDNFGIALNNYLQTKLREKNLTSIYDLIK